MNRRTFLQSTLAVTCASVACADQESKKVFPIVDTHQHLWDLTKIRLPWLKKVPKLSRSYLPQDYAEATAVLGGLPAPGKIVKTVYMEVDVAPEQQETEADFIIDLCKRRVGPTVAAVISGRPASDKFAKYIKGYKDSPYIKGVRQVLHGDSTPAGYCLEDKFVHGIRLLGELNLSYDICVRPGELADGAKLIDACPETRFILDHCGNGDVQSGASDEWKRGMAEVAKRKNVVCKVSGIVASAKPGKWTADDLAPFVNHTLEVFGPDRVMFGGDWPVCTLAATYREWVSALGSIVQNRPEPEQRKLFHDNAIKFYGLS